MVSTTNSEAFALIDKELEKCRNFDAVHAYLDSQGVDGDYLYREDYLLSYIGVLETHNFNTLDPKEKYKSAVETFLAYLKTNCDDMPHKRLASKHDVTMDDLRSIRAML